jgi:hypothetical protein
VPDDNGLAGRTGRSSTRARLGEWVVAINAAGQCGNGVLGEARCLRYAARVDNHTLWVIMIGVARSQGDDVVLSIPV